MNEEPYTATPLADFSGEPLAGELTLAEKIVIDAATLVEPVDSDWPVYVGCLLNQEGFTKGDLKHLKKSREALALSPTAHERYANIAAEFLRYHRVLATLPEARKSVNIADEKYRNVRKDNEAKIAQLKQEIRDAEIDAQAKENEVRRISDFDTKIGRLLDNYHFFFEDSPNPHSLAGQKEYKARIKDAEQRIAVARNNHDDTTVRECELIIKRCNVALEFGKAA